MPTGGGRGLSPIMSEHKYKKLTRADKLALEDSVRKYRRLSKASAEELMEADLATTGCGLCGLYYEERSYPMRCSGCPVSEFTGQSDCHGTPYFQPCAELAGAGLMYHRTSRLRAGEPPEAKLHRMMAEEADFLQSLLDNDPGKKNKRKDGRTATV